MNWSSFVTPFAKPIGALINKGLTATASFVLGYALANHWPMDAITPIVSMAVLGISTLISGLAATQGIQIPIINADETNGVKVVSNSSTSPAVNAPVA